MIVKLHKVYKVVKIAPASSSSASYNIKLLLIFEYIHDNNNLIWSCDFLKKETTKKQKYFK